MAKLKLDLHDIYNKGDKIEAELGRIMDEAVEMKIALVEIIPATGSKSADVIRNARTQGKPTRSANLPRNGIASLAA